MKLNSFSNPLIPIQFVQTAFVCIDVQLTFERGNCLVQHESFTLLDHKMDSGS